MSLAKNSDTEYNCNSHDWTCVKNVFLIIINRPSQLTFAMYFCCFHSFLAIMTPLHWLPCLTSNQFTITMFKKSSVIGWNILSPGEKKQIEETILMQYTLTKSRCHGTLSYKVFKYWGKSLICAFLSFYHTAELGQWFKVLDPVVQRLISADSLRIVYIPFRAYMYIQSFHRQKEINWICFFRLSYLNSNFT